MCDRRGSVAAYRRVASNLRRISEDIDHSEKADLLLSFIMIFRQLV